MKPGLNFGIFAAINQNLMNHLKIHTLLISMCLVLGYEYVASQDLHKIDLDGNWQFRQAGNDEWKEAIVPGTVHTDLLRNKIIPDPFYRDNEKDLQWVGDVGWEYERTFTLNDTVFRNQQIELVCKGLDTYANVFVNDSLVIVADNMFREWFADLRRALHPGVNKIRIEFPAIPAENKSRYGKLDHKLPGDDKVVCRKAAYHFGWDWGPTFVTSGIWRPIYIRYWNDINIMGVQYTQQELSDSIARISAIFTAASRITDSAQFKISWKNQVLVSRKQAMKKGVNVVRLNFVIRNPHRWWSNGLGEPYLYSFDHMVTTGHRTVARGTTRIGLRTLQLVEAKDWNGRSFFFQTERGSRFYERR